MIDYCVPPGEAVGLKKVRHSIINVWRPIRTIKRDPLALSDARSIPEEDLVHVTTYLAKGRTNMTWGVLPPAVDEKTGRQEKHKWYWCSEMTPDEVFLFKILDSKLDGRARRDPHSAFHIEGTEGEETRQSIEMRCMVFWEDEPKE
ncbi:hypothetical protein BKA65DRAFT_493698 [Rhexocercosporidium sp. MPI-PUGE-AT-0058]|nr:hypothetical protein BKA65DRAFT_493698 [Rhexocercosporidium sp. MPI-PUGE-AT-0058]